MRDQELIGLYEAYQQVHTQQRVINEEVEIASHYFCEMGLNEIGVEIPIDNIDKEKENKNNDYKAFIVLAIFMATLMVVVEYTLLYII